MNEHDLTGPPGPAAEPAWNPPANTGRAPVHLFTLRLWHAEVEGGRREWRGRLHHVGREDVRYFRGWAALLPVLLSMLRRAGVTISVEQEE